jgi:peptidoglycan hydrolase-like protein with peptidoglycan-binding domain
MKHLEKYILREALKSVNIKEQDEDEDLVDKSVEFVKDKYKKAEDAVKGAIGPSATDMAKTAALYGAGGYAALKLAKPAAKLGAKAVGVAAKGGTKVAGAVISFPAAATIKSLRAARALLALNKAGAVGTGALAKLGYGTALAGAGAGLLIAPTLAVLGTKAGNVLGDETGDLVKSTGIGTPTYFQQVGVTPDYKKLTEMVRKWGIKKGGRTTYWDDIESINTYALKVLMQEDFWKRVHARENEIQTMVSGRGDSTLSMVKNFWSNVVDGELQAAASGVPALTDAEKEELSRIARAKKTGKEDQKFSVTKRRIRAVGEVIQDESEKYAEEKDSDIDALDKWDGTSTSDDADIFMEHLLPGLSAVYSKWLFETLRDEVAAVAEKKLQDLVKKAEKAKDVPPAPEAEKAIQVATTAPIVPGAEPEEKTAKVKVKRSGVASSSYAEGLAEEAGTTLSAVQDNLLEFGLFDKPKDELKTFESGSADGIYGPETSAAIEKLQEKLNKLYKDNPQVDTEFEELKQDGLYGPLTHNALTKMINKLGKPAVVKAMKGSS